MERKKLFKKAFSASIPVLMGYTSMGMAAGILLAEKISRQDTVLWAFLTSASSISGALQFALADWISNHSPLLDVALLTLFLNFRYAMYGLSLLEKFKNIPFWQKCYLIWSLTDETYALETESKMPDKKDNIFYCTCIAMLDHAYWVIGVTAGALAGKYLPFPTKGIDFAMTALFLVVLTDQCRDRRNMIPAATGIAAAVIGRMFFSVENMIIPAMIIMTGAFTVMRRPLRKIFAQEK